MGRAPSYASDRAKLRGWADMERRVRNDENVIVEPGRGRYPECLGDRPYAWCPKPHDVPTDPKHVPSTCRLCQEHLRSKFYEKHFAGKARLGKIKRLQEAGLPTKIVSTRD